MALTKLIRIFSLSWSLTLQYRGDLFLWLIAITATPLLSLAVWYSVAASNSALVPRDILTYYIIIMFVRIATSSWRGFQLSQQILNGQIVQYLIRPPAILWEFVTANLTTKIFQLIIPVPVFLAIAAWKPEYFSPAMYQPNNIIMFIPALLLAALLSFAFDLCLGLLAFWIEDAHEIMSYRFLLTQVASGVIIPFSVMPDWLFTTFSLLPFRYTVSVPAEILLGQATGTVAWQLLGWQFVWATGFFILLRMLYTKGLKIYALPGQ